MGGKESNQANKSWFREPHERLYPNLWYNKVCYKETALYEDNLKDILTSDSCVAKITCISMIVLQS